MSQHDHDFLNRPAAEIVADPRFQRFKTAFTRGTLPQIPVEHIDKCFRACEGTVRDAMEDVYSKYGCQLTFEEIVADIRSAGAPEQGAITTLERELEPLRASLADWYALIGEPPEEE